MEVHKMHTKNVGTPVQRLEDDRLLRGKGRYVDDIDLPDQLAIMFVRSSEAHALIRSVDCDQARALNGVIGVYQLKDFGALADKPMILANPSPLIRQPITQYMLALDEVCYVGQAIAVVVAENRYIAEDAAQLVVVDYEPLPVVMDARKAAMANAHLVHQNSSDNLAATLPWKFGDIDQAFTKAPHIFKESYYQHRGVVHSMECRGVIAQYDAQLDQLAVWTSTQSPFLVRRFLAQFLEREEVAIRVIAPDVGGGFGPKAAHYPEELVATLLAIKLKRPIKWIEDRLEHFLTTTQQRDQWWDVEVACESDGHVLGMRAVCTHDNGAYLPYGLLLCMTSVAPFPGSYAIGAIDIRLDCMFTNAVPTTPIRGAGRPNATFVIERTMDTIARELKLDRIKVRQRNFVQKEQFPYLTGAKLPNGIGIQYDSGDYARCLDMVLESSQYSQLEIRCKEAAQKGVYRGIGIASYNEDSGLPPYEGATVKVLPSGKVFVELGSCSQGQGLETIVAQIAADQFGLHANDILVKLGDTIASAMALSTVGSRVASTAGPSVFLAAQAVRQKAFKLAAEHFNVSENEVNIDAGILFLKSIPDQKISLADLAKKLVAGVMVNVPQGFSPGLESTAYHTTERAVYANGSNVAEVEVDIHTGEVTLLNYWVAHDCGTVINPALVNGQIIGGVVHAIGNALFEHMKFDQDTGQPITTNLGEYLLPLATEMPQIYITHMESPSPLNPLGVKGAGEGGTIPGIACLISAIEDALKPFNVKINEYPLSPERLLCLIEEAKIRSVA